MLLGNAAVGFSLSFVGVMDLYSSFQASKTKPHVVEAVTYYLAHPSLLGCRHPNRQALFVIATIMLESGNTAQCKNKITSEM